MISWLVTTLCLDDFLAGHHSLEGAKTLLQLTLDTFEQLGVPAAPEKVEEPSSRLPFLGLALDTNSKVVCIPQDKREDLKASVASMIVAYRSKITLRVLDWKTHLCLPRPCLLPVPD